MIRPDSTISFAALGAPSHALPKDSFCWPAELAHPAFGWVPGPLAVGPVRSNILGLRGPRTAHPVLGGYP